MLHWLPCLIIALALRREAGGFHAIFCFDIIFDKDALIYFRL